MFDFRLKKLIKYFIVFNLFSVAFLVFFPAGAKQSNSIFISALLLVFVMFFLIGCIFFNLLMNSFLNSGSVEKPLPSVRQVVFNARLCSILSISGFVLIFIDRVYIRGIDYSAGLRAARYQWLESGSGSLFGVLGNLIIPFAYVALFILLTQGRLLKPAMKLLLVLGALFGIVGHAGLNGGRSNVLIALFIYLAIAIVRSRGSESTGSFYSKFFIFSFVALFIFYMTSLSASMSGSSYEKLFLLGVDSLHGEVTESYGNIGLLFGEPGYLFAYIVSYLFHGSWTTESLYYLFETGSPGGSYLLFSYSLILTMLGVLSEPVSAGYFSEYGAFVSLPGAFYYDVGLFGTGMLSLLLGMAVGFTIALVTHGVASPGVIAVYLYFTVIALMSPILPAYGLMYFNFVIYAFVMFGLINRLCFGKVKHWL